MIAIPARSLLLLYLFTFHQLSSSFRNSIQINRKFTRSRQVGVSIDTKSDLDSDLIGSENESSVDYRWNDRDKTWMQEANRIEYVVGTGMSFESLSSIGLNISSEDIFCNRELNMRDIQAVGFDMDWTLAQYNTAFDLLAYEGARQKLFDNMNYPKEVLELQYQPGLCRRGNVIDKRRGNILKLDRHKYVTAAEHGLTPMGREERKQLYRQTFQELQHFGTGRGQGFVCMDTPFSLVDCCLYAQLVDLKDRLGAEAVPQNYEQLWNDIRKCVDRCHKDGVIKLTVAQNPKNYITYDPNIFPMLSSFRESGKKVFLLTNSLWDYTHVVMNFLESRRVGENKTLDWMEAFDLIIVNGNKPAFLEDEGSLPLFRVDPWSPPGLGGELSNVEDDLPRSPAEMAAFLSEEREGVSGGGACGRKRSGKVFQGGNAQHLHKLLGLKSGDKLLYVGDHMFADILRSKRTLGWRTCLVVPELTGEIEAHRRARKLLRELGTLLRRQSLIESRMGFRQGGSGSSSYEAFSADVQVALQLAEIKDQVEKLQRSVDKSCHPRWGALFRARNQQSRFAKQVSDYACLYTSRASNLGLVSPYRAFRPAVGRLPHEDFLEALEKDRTESETEAKVESEGRGLGTGEGSDGDES